MKFKHISEEEAYEPEYAVAWNEIQNAAKVPQSQIEKWVEEGVEYLVKNKDIPTWYCESGDTLVLVTCDDDGTFQASVTTRRQRAYISKRG
jgi:hypothetical protein